jgi:hypothetical protein
LRPYKIDILNPYKMAKAKASLVIAEEKIVNQIHLIRGQKVMLDSDLAALYGVETKRLKEQVNRNLSRFPKTLYV